MPSTFKLMVPNELPSAEVFSEMPQSFRSYLSRGFEQVALLPRSKIDSLANLLAEGLEAMDEAQVTEILRRLEIQVNDKTSFGTALGLLTVFVTSREDVMDIVSAGEKAGVIPSASSAPIREIVSELAKGKARLRDVHELAKLANSVAPSFERLHIAPELRFGFEEAKLIRSVPVAICHLVTDSDEIHCFFQMTKSDVARLISQLKKVEAELNAIESWSKERK
ncbi:MAG: hypothetical protein ABSC48_19745 [Terracidiphilus sp.]|jgi:hypothetical protein